MLQKIRARLKQKGQGVVEYALLLGFVAIVTVGLISKDGLYTTFQTTLQSLTTRITAFSNYALNDTTNPPSGKPNDGPAGGQPGDDIPVLDYSVP